VCGTGPALVRARELAQEGREEDVEIPFGGIGTTEAADATAERTVAIEARLESP